MSPKTRHGLAVQRALAAMLEDYKYRVDWEKPVAGFIKKKNRPDIVTWVESDPDRRVVVSSKYQTGPGSVDEKVPFECIRLLYLMQQDRRFVKSYIVLDGKGWGNSKLAEFYRRGGLAQYIKGYQNLEIVTREELVDILRSRRLVPEQAG